MANVRDENEAIQVILICRLPLFIVHQHLCRAYPHSLPGLRFTVTYFEAIATASHDANA